MTDKPPGGVVNIPPQPSPPMVTTTQRYTQGGACDPRAVHDAFPPIGTRPGDPSNGKWRLSAADEKAE